MIEPPRLRVQGFVDAWQDARAISTRAFRVLMSYLFLKLTLKAPVRKATATARIAQLWAPELCNVQFCIRPDLHTPAHANHCDGPVPDT